MSREIETLQTEYGAVRRKVSTGCGVRREKYEFDDLAHIAKAQNLSLAEVRELLKG